MFCNTGIILLHVFQAPAVWWTQILVTFWSSKILIKKCLIFSCTFFQALSVQLFSSRTKLRWIFNVRRAGWVFYFQIIFLMAHLVHLHSGFRFPRSGWPGATVHFLTNERNSFPKEKKRRNHTDAFHLYCFSQSFSM